MFRRRPRHRYRPAFLSASIGERLGRELDPAPRPYRAAVLPPPPRPAKEVLALLMASTGLALAARKDAQVELLPGSPVTLLISSGGKLRAAMVLPVSEEEARKLVGQAAPTSRDSRLELLWEEDRTASFRPPDAELELHQEIAWGDGHAC